MGRKYLEKTACERLVILRTCRSSDNRARLDVGLDLANPNNYPLVTSRADAPACRIGRGSLMTSMAHFGPVPAVKEEEDEEENEVKQEEEEEDFGGRGGGGEEGEDDFGGGGEEAVGGEIEDENEDEMP